MNKSVDFEKIYDDFFGKTESNIKTAETNVKEEEKDKPNYNEVIDSLLISEESKTLLKKIFNYIINYDENKLYVNFNLEIDTDNKDTVKKIVNLFTLYAKDYVDINDAEEVSLYKLDNINDLNEIFAKKGIIVLSDIKGLRIRDNEYKKKLLYILNSNYNKRKIIIIGSSKEDVTELFNNDISLQDEIFNFKILGILPTSEQILLDVVSKVNIDDKDKDSLLDYIEKTYLNSGLDYPTYLNNLCKMISFNNEIPVLEKAKSTEEVFKELNELVGLEKVKKSLYDLTSLISLKEKTEGKLKLSNINLHMLFLGNPGTGKTTVARMLSNILYNLKYIRNNKLIEVSSKDLVAEYVGQTAPKTMDVVNSALGGILFIDEAYALATDKTNSYNKEAIATLIKAMEDYRDDLVVIFAGYTKEMEDFINANSGIASRIGYTFIFDDYTNEELKEIFKGMCKKAGFKVTKKAIEKLDGLIDAERKNKNFGNARFVRNVYEKTIIKHANNTKNIKDSTKLLTIDEEDIDF